MLNFESLEPRRLLAAGQLDPTFGDGGLVLHQALDGLALVGNDGPIARGEIILPMPDGRTVTFTNTVEATTAVDAITAPIAKAYLRKQPPVTAPDGT